MTTKLLGIALTALASACEAQLASTNLVPHPSNHVAPVVRSNDVPRFPTNLTTVDGKAFKGVVLRRLEVDGLVIDYTLDRGGIGLTKLKFKNLPEELQKQWKYDADKAAKFEAQRIQDAAEWRQKMIADEETGRATRAARELAQLQADLAQAEAAVIMAELRLKELERQRHEAEIVDLNLNLQRLRSSVDNLKWSVDQAAWRPRY